MDQRTNLAERLEAAEELISKVILNALRGENVTRLDISIKTMGRGSKYITQVETTLRAEVRGTRD